MRALALAVAAAAAVAFGQQSMTDTHWLRAGDHAVSTAEFIAKFEGMEFEPYRDAAGYPTVCVGHKLSDDRDAPLSNWPTHTRAECLDILAADLQQFEAVVSDTIDRELRPYEETALVSLAFNIGPGAFATSTLATLINADAPEHQVVLEWTSWSHAHVHGHLRVLEGLLDRRRHEVALFYGEPPE